MTDIFKIKKLDIKKIHPNSVDDKFGGSKVVVIGKPGTGKSTLIKSLLYAKKHVIPTGIVFSGTEDTNGFYSKFFPSTFIYNEYNRDNLERFITRQKQAYKKKLENPWAVCLIDDCTDDRKIFNDPMMVSMYKRGRHWKMLYILSLQYCLDIKPAIRANVDGVFLLKVTGVKQLKQLYENYAGMVPDFDTFCQIMKQVTQNYTALYIDNTNPNGDWKEQLYWYKADIPPNDFKFGCDEMWHWHYQKFNDEMSSDLN